MNMPDESRRDDPIRSAESLHSVTLEGCGSGGMVVSTKTASSACSRDLMKSMIFRLRVEEPSSSRCHPGPSRLLTSAGSSSQCVPDLPSYSRRNDQENDPARYRRTSSGVRWQAHQTAGLRGRSPGLVGIPDRQRLLGAVPAPQLQRRAGPARPHRPELGSSMATRSRSAAASASSLGALVTAGVRRRVRAGHGAPRPRRYGRRR
jgi:hypothetical protein